jgi:hypothetical protein
MAYDAATGNVVLFGGVGGGSCGLADTWVWDGSAWTQQHPATHPSARFNASMAYDAATGNVVLFGGGQGCNGSGPSLHDTWVWDGSTWIKQHPATHPLARQSASMAYDAATGNVVMFGGQHGSGGPPLRSTWVWDGSTWTQQHPVARPSGRWEASMAYDAATGNVVLFSGSGLGADTWVWDGSTWMKQHPVTSPSARFSASTAYDAATGNVVLFGGYVKGLGPGADTWVWDGSTWTQQHPVTSPSARFDVSMAYDAATGNVVLFSGYGAPADTWVWGSSS